MKVTIIKKIQEIGGKRTLKLNSQHTEAVNSRDTFAVSNQVAAIPAHFTQASLTHLPADGPMIKRQ